MKIYPLNTVWHGVFVFCIIIAKTLIFICGLLADKTKEKACLDSYSKSIILQPEKIIRGSVWGGEECTWVYELKRELEKFMQYKNVPILVCKMSIFQL